MWRPLFCGRSALRRQLDRCRWRCGFAAFGTDTLLAFGGLRPHVGADRNYEASGALWAVCGLPAAAHVAAVPARPDPVAGSPPPRAFGACVVHRGSLFVIGGGRASAEAGRLVGGLWDCWRFTPDDAEARYAHWEAALRCAASAVDDDVAVFVPSSSSECDPLH